MNFLSVAPEYFRKQREKTKKSKQNNNTSSLNIVSSLNLPPTQIKEHGRKMH